MSIGIIPAIDTKRPIQRMIAAAMAAAINADPELSAILTAEQVADPRRRLELLREGQMIVDLIGMGARFTPRNRRDGDRSYIVYLAIHQKLTGGVVTNDALDECGYWAERVQEFFHETAQNGVRLDSNQVAILTGSEPFPISRDALFGHGLHMSTYQFTWEMVR
jgi:hypothetical protein